MRIAFAPAGTLVSDQQPHGEATISYNVLKRLGARGHSVVAYCEHADRDIAGVELRPISGKAAGAVLSRLAFARRIANDIAAHDEAFDIIHHLRPINVAQGYTLASGAPLVLGPLTLPWHTDDSAAAPRSRMLSAIAGSAIHPVERRLHRRTLERASVLLVTGSPALAALPARLQERAIEVPLGVDTARFAPTPLPDDPVIVFLSVLLPRKGFDVLLRAMQAIRYRIPRAKLVIAGDDPRGLTPGARALAERLGVADAVEFTGSIAPTDTPALYRRARVFCQPSFGEPFGLTVLEAMASGRPVVATTTGGIAGFVRDGENGYLVPPGDERSLADALIRVLERPDDAARIGARNRDAAVRRYDWDRVVDSIEAGYERARGASGERRAG
jgi:glycosyltransferase involved in cell wall biosynthesis